MDEAALPLRERKKALTRKAIIDAARRLFAARGYDDVTVAEIADAANVSVKTLFVYFRSKEDLVFADNGLLDPLLTALAGRPPQVTPAQAVVAALREATRDGDSARGISDYHRAYGASPALRSGLHRMWADFEDRITAQLATEHAGDPTLQDRFLAIQLVGIIRTLTAPELRTAARTDPRQASERVDRWLTAAAAAVDHGRPPVAP
jgi:AcrR family transcriptional regulator